MSDIESFATGFSDAVTKYLGMKNEMGLRQQASDREFARNQEAQMAQEARAFENQQSMKRYENELDFNKASMLRLYDQTLAGKVDPETALSIHPQAGALVSGFEKKNKRLPTVEEFKVLTDKLDKAGTPATGAQKAVDREFAKEYTKYVAGGGYADTIGQIQSLEGVLSDLEKGNKQLTGPVVGSIPDFVRKRTNSESVAAQQAVESSVQRSLKLTLGGQFAQKEGELFMQRGYDPALPEKDNAIKLRKMIGQLKTMALAKQRAVDYYEEHGTLTGFKGTFYKLKDGVIAQATKDDFYKMIGEEGETPSGKNPDKGSDPLGLGI